jgi:hypothetical protein
MGEQPTNNESTEMLAIAESNLATAKQENLRGMAEMLGMPVDDLEPAPKKEAPAPEPEPEEEAEEADSAEEDKGDEDSDEAEPEETDEGADTDRIKGLEEKIAHLTELLEAKQTPAEDKGEPEPKKDKDGGIDFITEDQYTDALTSKGGLNTVLNTVYEAGVQATLKRMEPVIQQRVVEAINTHMAVQDFYRANPELAEHKEVVQAIAQKLIIEKGDKYPAAKLFKETATLAYKKLNLKQNEAKKREPKSNPGFSQPGKSNRGPATKSTNKSKTQQDMMAELLSADI